MSIFFFFKQKTAYELRISDWSSDLCSSDLRVEHVALTAPTAEQAVIEIAYGGVCGSDLHYWTHGAAGESILKAPMLLGHEVVGTVVTAAADGTGPAVERMSVVEGKSGQVRVDSGCVRFIKKTYYKHI